jgi:Luciferase/Rhodanese-like domain
MKYLKIVEDAVSAWPHITVNPHRFGGREFIFGSAEVGHVHIGGVVDIPFPRSVHDALLLEGLAEEHRWVPNSGWITFRIHNEQDIDHALWLMQLSYLRYTLKTASDPRKVFKQESEELHLSSRFKSLLEPFVPKRQNKFRLSRFQRRRHLKEVKMDSVISTIDLKAKLDTDKVTVVETLAPERFREAHIPGALNLPPEKIKELAPQLLPNKNAEIVTYCANTN